ncbi:hypothetical protein WJX72_007892 [[Myrmecia] bisecta]|uniref:Uncharacterized protein n=1 Tax=[Myrmecia] bisecta TaxID=41462 RepID=A0AAW1Q9D5_9CHLO
MPRQAKQQVLSPPSGPDPTQALPNDELTIDRVLDKKQRSSAKCVKLLKLLHPSLRTLSMSQALDEALIGQLAVCDHLEDLTLRSQPRTCASLDLAPLQRLSCLQRLELHCFLHWDVRNTLPCNLARLTNLQDLHLHMPLHTLPSELGALSRLRMLSLESNGCSFSMGQGLARLNGLESLALREIEFDKDVAWLNTWWPSGAVPTSLARVSFIEPEQDTPVPAAVCSLPALKELVWDNKMTAFAALNTQDNIPATIIDKQMAAATSLRELHLRGLIAAPRAGCNWQTGAATHSRAGRHDLGAPSRW